MTMISKRVIASSLFFLLKVSLSASQPAARANGHEIRTATQEPPTSLERFLRKKGKAPKRNEETIDDGDVESSSLMDYPPLKAKKAKRTGRQDAKQDPPSKKKSGHSVNNNSTMEFFFPPPRLALLGPDSSSSSLSVGNQQERHSIGTVYVFQSPLFFQNATAMPGASVTGKCTKMQEMQAVPNQDTILGGGHCHFTFVIESNEQGFPVVVFNAIGEVFDLMGGTLSIAGGTGDLVGVSGNAMIDPLYHGSEKVTDFFRDVVVYRAKSSLIHPPLPRSKAKTKTRSRSNDKL